MMKKLLLVIFFALILFSLIGCASFFELTFGKEYVVNKPIDLSSGSGIYTGEVKNGLPDGEGLFTYQPQTEHKSVRYYDGFFKNGYYSEAVGMDINTPSIEAWFIEQEKAPAIKQVLFLIINLIYSRNAG